MTSCGQTPEIGLNPSRLLQLGIALLQPEQEHYAPTRGHRSDRQRVAAGDGCQRLLTVSSLVTPVPSVLSAFGSVPSGHRA